MAFSKITQAKVRLQAKPSSSASTISAAAAPSATSAQPLEPTAPTSYANVVASSEPAHESGDHFVSEKDLEANTQEASAQQPLIPKHSKQTRQTSAIGVLKDTYKSKGFAGWYQGMQAQILKAVLSQGRFGPFSLARKEAYGLGIVHRYPLHA